MEPPEPEPEPEPPEPAEQPEPTERRPRARVIALSAAALVVVVVATAVFAVRDSDGADAARSEFETALTEQGFRCEDGVYYIEQAYRGVVDGRLCRPESGSERRDDGASARFIAFDSPANKAAAEEAQYICKDLQISGETYLIGADESERSVVESLARSLDLPVREPCEGREPSTLDPVPDPVSSTTPG